MTKFSLLLCFLTLQHVLGNSILRLQNEPGNLMSTRKESNDRPVIGILAQEISKTLLPPEIKGNSYIAASYVKYIESAGARALPIPTNLTFQQLTKVFKLINGISIPGGGASLHTSKYFKNAKIFFEMAIEANNRGDYFPIWGTCLGFESLNLLVDDNLQLHYTSSVDIAMPLNFTKEAAKSRLFGKMDANLMRIFSKEPVTYNFHKKCVSRTAFEKSEKLKTFFKVLSYNYDRHGHMFVSTIEGRKYPFYGSQWHPEKNAFEWNKLLHMPHSPNAIIAAQAMANFFVNEARKNSHHFNTKQEETDDLIYRFTPTYTPGGHFEQVYVF